MQRYVTIVNLVAVAFLSVSLSFEKVGWPHSAAQEARSGRDSGGIRSTAFRGR